MKELIKYLLDNLYIDFQGEITLETVRSFLREDDGREARQLLSKLIEEKGVDDMLITLADCLKEHIQSGHQRARRSASSSRRTRRAEPARADLSTCASALVARRSRLRRAPAATRAPRRQPTTRRARGHRASSAVRRSTTNGDASSSRQLGADDDGRRRTRRFRLTFDRFLLPTTAIRQSICVQPSRGGVDRSTDCIGRRRSRADLRPGAARGRSTASADRSATAATSRSPATTTS